MAAFLILSGSFAIASPEVVKIEKPSSLCELRALLFGSKAPAITVFGEIHNNELSKFLMREFASLANRGVVYFFPEGHQVKYSGGILALEDGQLFFAAGVLHILDLRDKNLQNIWSRLQILFVKEPSLSYVQQSIEGFEAHDAQELRSFYETLVEIHRLWPLARTQPEVLNDVMPIYNSRLKALYMSGLIWKLFRQLALSIARDVPEVVERLDLYRASDPTFYDFNPDSEDQIFRLKNYVTLVLRDRIMAKNLASAHFMLQNARTLLRPLVAQIGLGHLEGVAAELQSFWPKVVFRAIDVSAIDFSVENSSQLLGQ
jgi:hypothetical protein